MSLEYEENIKKVNEVFNPEEYPEISFWLRDAFRYTGIQRTTLLDAELDKLKAARKKEIVDRATRALEQFLDWCKEDPDNIIWFEYHYPQLVMRLRQFVAGRELSRG